MIDNILNNIVEIIITIFGTGTKMLIFSKLLNIAGVVLIVLMIKRWLINRKTDEEEYYD